MKISVIGAGYVGLTTASVFAENGHEVYCIDVDLKKISLIQNKNSPIAEEGIRELLQENVGKKLFVTKDIVRAVSDSDITFVCVQTPSKRDGSFDLSFLLTACKDIANALREKDYHILVVKSTVPPRTTEGTILPLLEKISEKKCGQDFSLVYSPEFMREGHALEDARHPSRIVIGHLDEKGRDMLLHLYSDFDCRKICCSPATAEMIKLASNAFLATKISFINEMGNICRKIGLDVYEVRDGMVSDPRISPAHLDAGLGFGGSCFPKDVRGLVAFSKKNSFNPLLLNSVMEVNENQVKRFLDMVPIRKGEKIGILGCAFKKDTDDVRESQALKVVDLLLKKKAQLFVYDPKAIPIVKKIYGSRINYCLNARDVVEECTKILILTDWEEFSSLDYRGKIVYDGRHIVREKEGVEYHGLAW